MPDKKKVVFNGHEVRPYLKTQEQGMKETTAVCSPGHGSRGGGSVKIQKDGKKNKEKKSEEEEKKGLQKMPWQETASRLQEQQQWPLESLARPRSQEGWVWRGGGTTGEEEADVRDLKRPREKKMAG